MRYCSKCGYPLNDNQQFCSKCGHEEPQLMADTNAQQPTLNTNKQNVNPFKVLKGIDKFGYIYNFVVDGYVFIHLLVSLFLYIEGNNKPNYLLANQILAIISSIIILVLAVVYIAIYIRIKSNKESSKTNKKVHLILMILWIVAFAASVAQIFVLKYFGLAIINFVSILVSIDNIKAIPKLLNAEQNKI